MKQDTIRIAGLGVDCVVGVYSHERNASQPLVIDLDLTLDTEPAATSESVHQTVDYASVTSQVVFLLRSCRFRLLETAAHSLLRLLLAPPAPGERRARLQSARVTLTKTGALRGFAVPSLTVERTADWAELKAETKPWGNVDIVHETREFGVYRLNLRPGGAIPLHHHLTMRESELILSSGLLCQGREFPPGTVHRWPRGAAHRYDNPSAEWKTILCVDSPPFLPEDEIEVEGEPADVPHEPPFGPIVGVG